MEMLERRYRFRNVAIILTFLIVFWMQCPGAEAHRNTTKMYYVCPPDFIRLGSSCFYFSSIKATWQNALFSCKDRDSNLTVPARWEDRNLRNFLNKPEIASAGRWIGGIYDPGARAWKWGGELREMHYQSFSQMKVMTPDELQWHCIAMMPELLYRWAPRSCLESRPYICQTRLRKMSRSERNNLRKHGYGRANEITVPSVDEDASPDPRRNEVTASPLPANPKALDVRPAELRRQRRLRLPFPGYTWDRRDPEAAYRRNVRLLRSGRTGLPPGQVNHHLRRLRRMRDNQLARLRRPARRDSDWLSGDGLRRPRSRSPPRARPPPRGRHPPRSRHPPRLAAAQHNTYMLDNHISALHPKTIIEVHEFPSPAPFPSSSQSALSTPRPLPPFPHDNNI